jgi:hypothetical protein
MENHQNPLRQKIIFHIFPISMAMTEGVYPFSDTSIQTMHDDACAMVKSWIFLRIRGIENYKSCFRYPQTGGMILTLPPKVDPSFMAIRRA